MPARAIRIRSLQPGDAQKQLGEMLQFLIAQGDLDFVGSISDSVRARVRWILERDADVKERKDRGAR